MPVRNKARRGGRAPRGAPKRSLVARRALVAGSVGLQFGAGGRDPQCSPTSPAPMPRQPGIRRAERGRPSTALPLRTHATSTPGRHMRQKRQRAVPTPTIGALRGWGHLPNGCRLQRHRLKRGGMAPPFTGSLRHRSIGRSAQRGSLLTWANLEWRVLAKHWPLGRWLAHR